MRVRALPRRTTSPGPYWTMLYDTPSFTGWQLENLEHARPRVPPAPADAADVPARRGPTDRRAAALVAQVARASLDPRRAVRRVSRRTGDPHPSRPAPVHRVARRACSRCLRFMRSDRDERLTLGPDHGDDLSAVPRAGDRAARRRHGAERPDRRHALPRADVGSGRDAAPGLRAARLRLAAGSRPRDRPTTSTPSPRPSTGRTPTPSPTSASTRRTCAAPSRPTSRTTASPRNSSPEISRFLGTGRTRVSSDSCQQL